MWQEDDAGGRTLVNAIVSSAAESGGLDIKVIQAPPVTKDPNELMQQTGDEFLDAFNGLLDSAAAPPNPLASFDQEAIRQYVRSLYTLGYILGWDERRETAGKALRAEATRDGRVNGRMLDKAEAVDRCAINWCRYKCNNLGEIVLRRNKCGDPACPYCALWKLENFLTSKMAEIERLANPTVYEVTLGKQRLHEDRERKVESLKAVYAEMRLWMTHLTDNAGTAHVQMTRDHMYHLYTCLERHVLESKIIMLAEYDEAAAGVLEEHFRREVTAAGGDPAAVRVTVVKHENVKDAVSAFQEIPSGAVIGTARNRI